MIESNLLGYIEEKTGVFDIFPIILQVIVVCCAFQFFRKIFSRVVSKSTIILGLIGVVALSYGQYLSISTLAGLRNASEAYKSIAHPPVILDFMKNDPRGGFTSAIARNAYVSEGRIVSESVNGSRKEFSPSEQDVKDRDTYVQATSLHEFIILGKR